MRIRPSGPERRSGVSTGEAPSNAIMQVPGGSSKIQTTSSPGPTPAPRGSSVISSPSYPRHVDLERDHAVRLVCGVSGLSHLDAAIRPLFHAQLPYLPCCLPRWGEVRSHPRGPPPQLHLEFP